MHNDKARYTHQALKAESEEEHVCLFRINGKHFFTFHFVFSASLLYIHKQQIEGDGELHCGGTIMADAGETT